jgi:hypothetical protein
MEEESSLALSQDPSTGSNPEPFEFSLSAIIITNNFFVRLSHESLFLWISR